MPMPILAAASIPTSVLITVVVVVLLVFSMILVIVSRFRRCPSDKVMVIYGKVGQNKDGTARSAKCIHGGAAFIMPVVQDYEYLDLTPMSLSVDLKSGPFAAEHPYRRPRPLHGGHLHRARHHAERR